MSKHIKAFLTILFVSSFSIHAQDSTTVNKTTISIETDPSTFLFNGYAFHVRVKPKFSKHLLIGGGTYALNFPELLVDMNPSNKDKGWEVRINSAYSIFGEYYFKQANNKTFVGLQVGVQNFLLKNTNHQSTKSKYANLIVMPSLGYNWQPFKFPLYIKPWIGLGYTTKISGNNTLDDKQYAISNVVPFVTMHLGYTFGK